MARNEALSVAELEKMLAERRAELGRLMAQRDQIDARIAELTGGGMRRRGRGRGRVAVRRKPGRGRVRNQPALKQVINDILQKSKKALSLDEIIEKVQATGYKSNSGNFRQVAYLNLFHMKKNGEVEHDSASKLYRATSA
jgi:hypothetical protein